VRATNQNLIANMQIVARDVIDDAKRYIPQPTFRKSLLLNVKKERMLLVKPAINIIIVKAALIFTKNG
jgi:hypothetical protein